MGSAVVGTCSKGQWFEINGSVETFLCTFFPLLNPEIHALIDATVIQPSAILVDSGRP